VVLLADTNIWLAAADRRSDRHGECASLLRGHRGELAAPVPVIAEASWRILDRLDTAAQAAYLRLITSGQLTPVDLTGTDWQRCAHLAEQYASLRLDLIDASLVGRRTAQPHGAGHPQPPRLRRRAPPPRRRVRASALTNRRAVTDSRKAILHGRHGL
jgi:predicted nucleic acid-binding protein